MELARHGVRSSSGVGMDASEPKKAVALKPHQDGPGLGVRMIDVADA